jgi:hypothetical protein
MRAEHGRADRAGWRVRRWKEHHIPSQVFSELSSDDSTKCKQKLYVARRRTLRAFGTNPAQPNRFEALNQNLSDGGWRADIGRGLLAPC